MISVARAGLDTGKRFSVGCLVLRGFLAVSSAIRSRVEITSAGSGSKVGPRGPLAPAGVAAARCLKA